MEWVTGNLFHMSAQRFSPGDKVCGNGRDKVDPRIESELEAARPDGALSRRDAIFCRDLPDFSRCGIVDAGYIYRVTAGSVVDRYDLSWIGEMQKAVLREKHGDRFASYPEWTRELVRASCAGYWSGNAFNQEPVWECLTPDLVITEIVTEEPIEASKTRGGWRATRADITRI